MKNIETVQKVWRTYKLQKPVSPEIIGRIIESQKKVYAEIIKLKKPNALESLSGLRERKKMKEKFTLQVSERS